MTSQLLDIDVTALARELTLMEAFLYNKTQTSELVHRSTISNARELRDNVYSMIQLSNNVANWVAESVLAEKDTGKRAVVIEHFIKVADNCREIQNYSSMVSVISGLNTPAIRRLEQTWAQVNADYATRLRTCESTLDTTNNFTAYRATLASISPPAVPFIGVYLTLLSQGKDGGQGASGIVQEFQRLKAVPFDIESAPGVRSYLEDSLNKYEEGVDQGDRFWSLSLEREPLA